MNPQNTNQNNTPTTGTDDASVPFQPQNPEVIASPSPAAADVSSTPEADAAALQAIETLEAEDPASPVVQPVSSAPTLVAAPSPLTSEPTPVVTPDPVSADVSTPASAPISPDTTAPVPVPTPVQPQQPPETPAVAPANPFDAPVKPTRNIPALIAIIAGLVVVGVGAGFAIWTVLG